MDDPGPQSGDRHDDDISPAEEVDDLIEVSRHQVGELRIRTSKVKVLAEGILLPSPDQLAVTRDQHGTAVICVGRNGIIVGLRQSSVGDAPCFMAALPETCSNTSIYVLVEDEAHSLSSRWPSRSERHRCLR